MIKLQSVLSRNGQNICISGSIAHRQRKQKRLVGHISPRNNVIRNLFTALLNILITNYCFILMKIIYGEKNVKF